MALDYQPIAGESEIRPRAGERTTWKNGTLTWQELTQDDYVMDFISLLGRVTTPSVAYAVSYVRSETLQSGLRLLLGSDANARLYLNGQPVHDHTSGHPFEADRDIVNGITLKPGLNVIILKLAIRPHGGLWRSRASVRFTDADGKPVKSITVTLDPGSAN